MHEDYEQTATRVRAVRRVAVDHRLSIRLERIVSNLLVNACRYVYLNPVRAGLCARPQDWPWSGIRS